MTPGVVHPDDEALVRTVAAESVGRSSEPDVVDRVMGWVAVVSMVIMCGVLVPLIVTGGL